MLRQTNLLGEEENYQTLISHKIKGDIPLESPFTNSKDINRTGDISSGERILGMRDSVSKWLNDMNFKPFKGTDSTLINDDGVTLRISWMNTSNLDDWVDKNSFKYLHINIPIEDYDFYAKDPKMRFFFRVAPNGKTISLTHGKDIVKVKTPRFFGKADHSGTKLGRHFIQVVKSASLFVDINEKDKLIEFINKKVKN
jgi:hypothetical protein